MNPEDAVVDEIDRLVEESLTKPWHQVSGYDNNIGQPRCRCGADWHGLPTAFCPGWMMMLPDGHVTGVGLSRNEQLKAIGNGVVPAQALAALEQLVPIAEQVAS